MTTVIDLGHVKQVLGKVEAVALDGSIRQLKVGDRIFVGEQILVSPEASVVVQSNNGKEVEVNFETRIALHTASAEFMTIQGEVLKLPLEIDFADLVRVTPQSILDQFEGEKAEPLPENTPESSIESIGLADGWNLDGDRTTPGNGFGTSFIGGKDLSAQEDGPIIGTESQLIDSHHLQQATPTNGFLTNQGAAVFDAPPIVGRPSYTPTPEDPRDDKIDLPVFSIADAVVNEGGQITITVTRTGSAIGTQTIEVNSELRAGLDAAEANDFTGVVNQVLSFNQGETEKTFIFQSTGDNVFEGAELVNLVLSNASPDARISDTDGIATVKILDDGSGPTPPNGDPVDDDRPILSIMVTDAVANEADPTDVVTFTINNNGGSEFNSSVDFILGSFNGSSLEAEDITQIVITDANGQMILSSSNEIQTFIASGSNIILSQNSSATVTLTAAIDGVLENVEDFSAQISNAINATIDPARSSANAKFIDAPFVEVEDSDGNITTADNSIIENAINPVAGAFTLHSPAGLKSITLDGNLFTTAQLQNLSNTSQSITTTDKSGTLTLTDLVNNADGSISIAYSYQQLGLAMQHEDASGNPIDIIDTISLIATDLNDTASANSLINIQIIDDVPTAVNDLRSIVSDAAPVVGNVISGVGFVAGQDSLGADGAATIQLSNIVSDNTNTASAITVAGTVSIAGEYGTLTIDDQGEYSYTLFDSDNVNDDVFTYTLVDADGDTATATLTIDGRLVVTQPNPPTPNPNPVPTPNPGPGAETGFSQEDNTVYEFGLRDNVAGVSGVDKTEMVAGSFTVSGDVNGDAISTIEIAGQDGIRHSVILDSASYPTNPVVSVTGDFGTIKIIGYTFDASTGIGTVNYTYEIDASKIHAEPAIGVDSDNNVLTDTAISVIATSVDSNETSSALNFNIVDDVPTANDDARALVEGNSGIGGNVITGVGDISGKDAEPVDTVSILGIVAGDGALAVESDYNSFSITSTFGTLTIDQFGEYTYTLNGTTDVTTQVIEQFSYALKDGDGDIDTAVISFTIAPKPAGPTIQINGSSAVGVLDHVVIEASTTLIDNRTITVTTESGSTINELTITGKDLSQVINLGDLQNTPVTITGAQGGSLTISSFNSNTGDLTYSYTENGIADDHSSGDIFDEFTIFVKDSNNLSSTNILDIQIVDTAPTAIDDTHSNVNEDNAFGQPNIFSGNVITAKDINNIDTGDSADTLGEDLAITAINITHANDLASGVGSPIQGDFGVLTLYADGSYDYELDSIGIGQDESGTDVFTYTIKDDDGDESSAFLTFNIEGESDVTTTMTLDAGHTKEDVTLVVTAGTGVLAENAGVLENDINTDSQLRVAEFTVTGTFNSGGPYAAGTSVDIFIPDPAFPSDASKKIFTGQLTLNVDGGYTFVPAENYNGTVPDVLYSTNTDAAAFNGELTIVVDPVPDTLKQGELEVQVGESTVTSNAADLGLDPNDPDVTGTDTHTTSSGVVITSTGGNINASLQTSGGLGLSVDSGGNGEEGNRIDMGESITLAFPTPMQSLMMIVKNTKEDMVKVTSSNPVVDLTDPSAIALSGTINSTVTGNANLEDTKVELAFSDGVTSFSYFATMTDIFDGGLLIGEQWSFNITDLASHFPDVSLVTATSLELVVDGIHYGNGGQAALIFTSGVPLVDFTFHADPSVASGGSNDNGYQINEIFFGEDPDSFDSGSIEFTYEYPVDIAGPLVDSDGSEQFTSLLIGGFPAGVELQYDGVTLLPIDPAPSSMGGVVYQLDESVIGTSIIDSTTFVDKLIMTSTTEVGTVNFPFLPSVVIETTDQTLDASGVPVPGGEISALSILGGTADDLFVGSDNDDAISGGKGSDSLEGGAGNDIFYWNAGDAAVDASDTITDFNVNEDTLDLSQLLEGATAANIADYITVSGDTLTIDYDGSAGPSTSVQTIILEGINLGTDNTLLDQFITDGTISVE